MANETLDFWSPRFVGQRFDDHAMPLELLRDLAVLEEMVIETAKWLYLSENDGRKRTPKGFTDAISIKISGIGEGSSVSRLVLSFALGTSHFAPPSKDFFERARDSITNAVEAAETGTRITDYLPESLLGYFDRIGRGLRDNEYIEFRPERPDSPARLTKETRRRLLFESSTTKEFAEDSLVRGMVSEIDQEKGSFFLTVNGGRRILAPLVPQHYKALIDATVGYKNGQKILLEGVGKKNRSGTLLSMESVEHVTLLDPFDIDTRLEELADLKDGWLDGAGRGFDSSTLIELGRYFASSYGEDLALPRLYPTLEGRIRAEWSSAIWEVSLEIDPTNLQAEYQALRIADEFTDDRSLNLATPEGWSTLNSLISNATTEPV
ncbi:MAG: hypothetical protein WCQ50_08760 [Spirochaetota bacterium]